MGIDKKSKPENVIEFDKTYKVMLLRLKRGWSAFELSWLLGYRDFYVRDVENPLHKLQYASADTNYLQLIFNCGYEYIIAPKIEPAVWKIAVEVKVNDAQARLYLIYLMLERKKKLLYEVTEEEKKVEYPAVTTANESELVIYIGELIKEGYFNEPRTRLDLFNKCQKNFGTPLKPLYVINAVGKLTRQHGYPKLGLGDQTDMSRATLEMIFEHSRASKISRLFYPHFFRQIHARTNDNTIRNQIIFYGCIGGISL